MGHVDPLGYELFGLAAGAACATGAPRDVLAAENMWDGVILDPAPRDLTDALASGRALRPSSIFQRAD